METKIKYHLCANYEEDKLKSAIVSAVLCDYIIEELSNTIKQYAKFGLDLFYVHEDFKTAIDKSFDVSFSSIEAWEQNKISAYNDCIRIVAILDNMATSAGKIERGSLISTFTTTIQTYLVLLNTMTDVTISYVDFGGMKIKKEIVDGVLSQLSLVDEGQFLADLGTMQISVAPLEITKYRNKFIEKKLKRAQTIYAQVFSSLEREFTDLHNEIMDSYDKFYSIIYATLGDSEKSEEARKVWKFVGPHRLVLDRLENKMTEANELKRQLVVHEKTLRQEKKEKTIALIDRAKEYTYEKESVDRELDSLNFVFEEYVSMIHLTVDRINKLEEDIAERYNILDRVENALKNAVPSESEMKRYTGVAFKFEDLFVRLELAKSQSKSKDKEYLQTFDTAVTGLGVLMNIALEGKDVYMRNTFLSAIFNCVNGIYDLVNNKNKSIELSQIKFVTSRLVQYSLISNTMTKDLQTFRHVCNNAIRDIAITMGKPLTGKNMFDLLEEIDMSIKQIQELLDTINKNHEEQTRLLGDILNV